MVGFVGFVVIALGGLGLALLLGVPPIFIGAYIVGLLILGAITGFSTNKSEGGRSSSGSGSSGNGGSRRGSKGASNSLGSAAGSFIDSLGAAGGSGRSNGALNTTSDYPSDLQERGVNRGQPDRSGGFNHTDGTTKEDYINSEPQTGNMGLRDQLGGVRDSLKRAEKFDEDELTKMGQLAQQIEEEEKIEEKLEHLQEEEIQLIKNMSNQFKDLESKEEKLTRIIEDIESGGTITQRKWDNAKQLADEIKREAEEVGEEMNQLHKYIVKEDKLVSSESEDQERIDELEQSVEEEYRNYQELIGKVTQIKGAELDINLGPGTQQ